MSSQVMTKPLTTNHEQNVVSKTSSQLSPKDKQLIIDGLIAILEEDKLKPWVSNGLRDEYQRRHQKLLPDDWLAVVEEFGPEVIEVVTMSLTNVSKTLIQLPIRKSKNLEVTTPNRKSTSDSPPLLKTDLEQKPPEPKSATPDAPRTASPGSRSETLEPRVAQLISLSPERPNPKLQNSDPTAPVQTSMNSLSVSNGSVGSEATTNRYQSLLDEITPFDQNIAPNLVPNNINDKTSSVTNETRDEPKAKTSAFQTELMNGTVEDVIFGGKPIPPATLPPVKPTPVNEEDFFDVVVLLAANPSNFIVVPFKNSTKTSDFYHLKYKMIELYEKEENRIDLPPEVIQKGIFVAAKAQESWYRVQVMSVLSENPFQVVGYLCDFGEHKTFDLSSIQPLYNCFRDLPMQAIRASLATVSPIGSDWDVITSYEFRQMVEQKPFVATVYAIKQVDGHPVLSLSLCDTSGDDDLYVGTVLTAKRLAKPVVTSI